MGGKKRSRKRRRTKKKSRSEERTVQPKETIEDASQEVSEETSEEEDWIQDWASIFVRSWGRRGPVAQLLSGQLKQEESALVTEAWRKAVEDREAYQLASQASDGDAEEVFWFFRGEEFIPLHVPSQVLNAAFVSVGELPYLDAAAPEAQPWLSLVYSRLMSFPLRCGYGWELLKMLPGFVERGRMREAWMIMMAARDLEETVDKVPICMKALLQESVAAWSDTYDISLSHALRSAGLDFSPAPSYGTEAFEQWVEAALLGDAGRKKVFELLGEKLGTSEAAAQEVQRIASESLAVLEDPAFVEHKLRPKEGKALAKQLKKRKLDLIQGRSPRAVLEEIYGKKSEDYFPPKRKKKLMTVLEAYRDSLGEEQEMERFRADIAMELMMREVDAKNPFLLEYLLSPALAFYEDHYA